MSDRKPAVGSRGQHRGAGARPFAPGEAPPGVRPGLAGGPRRAGVTPVGGSPSRRTSEEPGTTSGRGARLTPGTAAQLRRLALGALLLASFLLPPVAARASLTTVGQISVVGTQLLDPDAVIAAANIPIGSSLLGVNLSAAEEAVAALPLVASVRVSAGLPDGIQIRVREKSLLLRWQIGDRIYAVSQSGELLGETASLNLAPSAAAALAAAPLLYDDRTPSPLLTAGQLTATELDVATRLASLTPEDLGTAATTLTLRLTSDFGFVVEATGPSIEWNAVFGIYSATIRPTSMIPGQVRLLRSLLAGRESRIGWVILADDQAGTYTAKGVRPPPPAAEPSPSLSPAPSDPSPSPSAPTVSP
jgi:cell division septal protein FtsQ